MPIHSDEYYRQIKLKDYQRGHIPEYNDGVHVLVKTWWLYPNMEKAVGRVVHFNHVRGNYIIAFNYYQKYAFEWREVDHNDIIGEVEEVITWKIKDKPKTPNLEGI